ncbi:polyprenol monophosphomannose synthase [Subtercola lobariae]|uniref:Dolichol-phosphate mannosyltransferase n=1 Tax=Subtercola lobariae TaxID=1588641 RepID=A0A917BIG4_9MICO|nr:polyprenol monophosphomannose synthase [Subtercola lobariae]GGF41499.1 dolichol-phosphate mannosyltransferase [Subtercola lobariae]
MNEALVIIPTYNEKENISSIVARVLTTRRADVLIVDDGSPDGTGEIADHLARLYEEVSVLHRPGKQGLGRAYVAGFDWGRARGYKALVEMDADGSHHPESLPLMLDMLDDDTIDIVLGSRWVQGGVVVNWPLRRRLLSRGGNAYARIALGISIKDATGGYRVYRRSAIERIRLTTIESDGYCFQLDMLWRGLQTGLRVVEVPIIFTERTHGTSKMSGMIVAESLMRVTRWGLQRRAQSVTELVLHRRRLPSVRTVNRTQAPSR